MRTVAAVLILAVGIAAGVAVGRALDVRIASGRDDRGLPSFAEAARRVVPSVVHITREGYEQRFVPWVAEESRSVGSGVIVSAEGHVLTNLHVVGGEETRRIVVKTHDGRSYRARVIGTDPESDLAVLKIEADAAFQPAVMGRSADVRVGDWVLAAGSPFELNHSVTAGIVSAKGRRADLTIYEDYIQTDAAIHPGSSGGALVNLRGEVVGIMTAVLGRGGATGIGYAIPSDLAVWVKDQILAHGEVRRGWLGVLPADVDEALLAELADADVLTMEELLDRLGLDRPRGAYVMEVLPGPAAEAGIRPRDVITAMDGGSVETVQDLMIRVAQTAPGTRIRLRILRDRTPRTVEVVVGRRPLPERD